MRVVVVRRRCRGTKSGSGCSTLFVAANKLVWHTQTAQCRTFVTSRENGSSPRVYACNVTADKMVPTYNQLWPDRFFAKQSHFFRAFTRRAFNNSSSRCDYPKRDNFAAESRAWFETNRFVKHDQRRS